VPGAAGLAYAMPRSDPTQPPLGYHAPDDGDEETFSAWVLIWTIVVAKAATLLLILWAVHDFEAGILLVATTWIWLVAIAALCAAPILFRIRLRRVRAKREALQRAEWMIGEERPEAKIPVGPR
jgi:membrane protein YdbS with pleckstrin-like domain